MKAIVTVSLCGTEFEFDDEASSRLRRYFAAFEAAFADSCRAVRREELDRMLKERLTSRLKCNKTTLVETDVEAVLIKLPAVGAPVPARRRLSPIPQGSAITGVCLGIAACSPLDVGPLRWLFVLTAGISVISCLVAMFVAPVVDTVEQAKLALASA